MSKIFYALRMLVDLNDGETGKFSPHNEADSRQWYTSPNGNDHWTPTPKGNSDSDNPTLYYRYEHPKESDEVQFEVYFQNLGERTVKSIEIVASFGSRKGTNTTIASPFRLDGGNLQTILGLEGYTYRIKPAPHYLIGPYQVALDRMPNPVLPPATGGHFEFTLAVKFVLVNGLEHEVLEFSHDPEMDVEPGSGPLPPEDVKA